MGGRLSRFPLVVFFAAGIWAHGSAQAASSVRPNDPYFGTQSALFTEESADSSIGRAWEIATDASNVIVAVIDTGAELDHPDLSPNLWTNSGEIPGNGIDDDGDDYVDDVHGYDFKREDGEPEDEWGHGTLISGIIGAVGNNGIGTSGVAWKVQLMILKVFGDAAGARMADYTDAIHYAINRGARIINASWTIQPSGADDDKPLLRQAIQEAESAGILVVTSAGNDGRNIDDDPVFPAAYSLDNILSVGGLKAGVAELLDESNFGPGAVKIAANGDALVGPYLSQSYAALTGTSASAALVSGVAALIYSQRPDLPPETVAGIIMNTSVPSDSLAGLIASGGEIDAYASLEAALSVETESAGETSGAPASPEMPSLPSSGGCSLIPE